MKFRFLHINWILENTDGNKYQKHQLLTMLEISLKGGTETFESELIDGTG